MPKSSRCPPPVIESYELEKLAPASAEETSPRPIARLTLHGRNFFIRAVVPRITIGDTQIIDYEIMPNEKTIVLHLFARPPEGATIKVSYGSHLVGESEKPFTWS